MATWIWILIAIAAAVVVALAVLAARKRRTEMLRERFGPEYDRAVQAHDDRRGAEADLRARERQRARFDIKPMPEADRLQFAAEWRGVQEQFVDQPQEAVTAADTLVNRVMEACGYPMRDFEAQADLVSVDHPGVVENYRLAHGVWQRSQAQQASTEDMRDALLRYRSLFAELLRPDGDESAATPDQADGEPAPAGIRRGQAQAAAPGDGPISRAGSAPAGATAATPEAAEPETDDVSPADRFFRGGGR